VSGLPGDDHAIELHLPDGGHVILTIEDSTTRLGDAADQLIGTLLKADGGEHEIERALVATAGTLGLVCSVSTHHHPTVLSIRRD
jgi:hypothetical protein